MFLTIVLVAIIGILAGGIVNVLADDLPQRRRPTRPKYPDDTPRPPSAWMGLMAFLLGQRESPEGAKLSWRHPIAELLTAALMVLTVVVTKDEVGGLQLVFWLVYMAIFVLITIIDIEHKLILFAVIIPSAILALLDALLTTREPAIGDALIGAAIGFGVFFLLYNGGFLFTYIMARMSGDEIDTVAFGYGDVMMATLSGLMLGWRAVIFAIFITVFLGAIGAMIYLLVRGLSGAKYSKYTALPYGPYIVVGTLIMLLFRDTIPVLLGWS